MPLTNAPKTGENSGCRRRTLRGSSGMSIASSTLTLKTIGWELKAHAPFTLVGAATGIVIMMILSLALMPRSFSVSLFWWFHPFHVFLSALVTAGMYRVHSAGTPVKLIARTPKIK